uniref:Uncharacterized protein n=1 Tax=Avena sativa TaxID=4498 RepID=A0ACD5XET8_AVESA
MIRRGWVGDPKCAFCQQDETISHLFFQLCCSKNMSGWCLLNLFGAGDRPLSFSQYFWWIPWVLPISRNIQITALAAVCWAIWKTRNRAFFEKKLINSPAELICFACVFMNYWAGLHSVAEQDIIRAGASTFEENAVGNPVRRDGCDLPRLEAPKQSLNVENETDDVMKGDEESRGR